MRMTDQKTVPLSQDVALVAALAGTAMPFAHSAEDQAARWLRAMRLHGQVGRVLQALGVGESALTERADAAGHVQDTAADPEIVEHVIGRARERASGRASEDATVTTIDLLHALFDEYGELFDRALYVRGSSRDEVLERLVKLDQLDEIRR